MRIQRRPCRLPAANFIVYSKFFSIFLLFLGIILFSFKAYPQTNFLWSNGGNGNDEALANCLDSSGNIYTTGYFSLGAKFDTTVMKASGSGDLFITKQNSAGDYLWAVHAGGFMSDRGYGIFADGFGYVYVTGFFSGSADFGSTTLISNNNSLDVFVAKLDGAGNFLWAKSFGGGDIDIGLGITTDRLGEVIVTGQFRETAQFGSFSFTSMNDTIGLPSYDIFIMKLDTSGAVLWAKQGASKYDDRGISVSTDSDLNIYLAGQYSDTLTFGNVYPSVSRSVSFLAKLDSAGNNNWIRQLTAQQVLIYSVVCRNNMIYLGGDFTGTLTILDNPPFSITKNYAYKIFAAKLDTAGHVKWASCDGSDNPVTALDMDVDKIGNAYLAGTFNCVMTEYSQLYGSAVFNSVGFRDVFITKFDTGGVREYEKQFAGPGDDYCSAISVGTVDEPVIAGSFEIRFNSTSTLNFKLNATNSGSFGSGPFQPAYYCNDYYYNKYISTYSDGNKDIFSARPVVASRESYDYYERTGTSCIRNLLTPYINLNEDTISGCDSVKIFTTRRTGDDGIIGPQYKYEWFYNSMSGSPFSVVDKNVVTKTGWYYLKLATKDGCKNYLDSIYVIVYKTPPLPIIGYTKGRQKDAIPGCPRKLLVLNPDTAVLYGTNVPPGYIVEWNTPYGLVQNDSIPSPENGVYTITILTPDRVCQSSDCIEIFNYIVGVYPDILVPELHFTNSAFDLSDTVEVCEMELFSMTLVDSTDWANGDSITLFPTFVDWYISGGFNFKYYLSYPTTFLLHYQTFQAFTSGPCTVTAVIEDPFTGAPLFTIVRSFYLKVNPLPPLVGLWHGPLIYCPGDTVLLTLSGGTNYQSSGPGVFKKSVNEDSLWVTQPGRFTSQYITIDSVTGCSSTDTIYFDLIRYPAPKITMIPANGVICPNDSLQLIAENGSSYVWTGPLGNTIDTTQSIWVNAPGRYHYDFANTAGCKLVSEFVEVKNYSTPYLYADPSPLICIGNSVDIVVFADSLALIQWLPPLSGNSPKQTITAPGLYQCNITSCGITTVASITIIPDVPAAKIRVTGNDFLCTGDTLILIATSGMASYQWLPANYNSQLLSVTKKGTYTLIVTNYNGCTASDSITIDSFPRPASPLTGDTIICAGDTATLHAIGLGTLTWFDSNIKNANVIDTGNAITFISVPAYNDTVFYVADYDSVCYSYRVPARVLINPSSLLPVISGKRTVCRYDTLVLSGPSYPGINYSWTGPLGFTASTQTITIAHFDSSSVGYYSLQISDTQCTSPVNTVFVSFFPTNAIRIIGASSICPGTSVVLSSLIPQQSYQWHPSNLNDSTISVDSAGTIILTGIDLNGCHDTSLAFTTSMFPVPVPPHANDTSVCAGDSIQLFSSSTGTISWYDINMQVLYTGNPYNTSALFTTTKYYLQLLDSNSCLSGFDSVVVSTKPIPPPPVITSPPGFCLGDPILITADTLAGAVYSWTGPNGYYSVSHNVFIPNAVLADSGSYTVFVILNGCLSSDSVSINIIHLPPITINSNSPICIGETFSFSASGVSGGLYNWYGPLGYTSTQQSDSFLTSTITQSGYYYLDVLANGCRSRADSTYLKVSAYPFFDLGSDTTICFGKAFSFSAPSGYDSYQWSTGATSPAITVSSAGIIYLTAMNYPHCSFTDSIVIDTIECNFLIPNVFTPNRDGLNDYYYFDYRSARNIHIIIFDRWGNKIQELSGKTAKWDGKNKEGSESHEGVYYYVADVINYSGKPETYHGWIQLIR